MPAMFNVKRPARVPVRSHRRWSSEGNGVVMLVYHTIIQRRLSPVLFSSAAACLFAPGSGCLIGTGVLPV